MIFTSRLAQLISQYEGFGRPGAIPTLRHNPGDLRHAPHASHEGLPSDAIGMEPSDSLGASDLEHQLTLYAARGLTLQTMIHEYAPPSENHTDFYLRFITEGLDLPATTTITDALAIHAIEEPHNGNS